MTNWLAKPLDEAEIEVAEMMLFELHPLKDIHFENLFTSLRCFKGIFQKIRAWNHKKENIA